MEAGVSLSTHDQPLDANPERLNLLLKLFKVAGELCPLARKDLASAVHVSRPPFRSSTA